MVYTVGLALLVDTVGRDSVGAWMGFALSGMTNGVMIGPLLGGLIYAKAGYYAVFVVVLAVIAVDAVLRLIMVEKKRSKQFVKESSEENGYGTFSINDSNTTHNSFTGPRAADQGSFDDRLESISELGRDCKTTYSSEPNGENDALIFKDQKPIATNAPFSTRSHVSRYFSTHFPTIFALLGSPRLIAAMYGAFVELSLITSFDSILPRFVHKTFGWDSTGGGVIFLAITVPSLTGPLLGVLSDRLGTRAVVLGGFSLCIGTIAIFTPLAADMSHVVEALSTENETLFGQNGAYAQAYGLFDLALAFGQMLGPTLGGFVYEKWGWETAAWSLAAFSASGVIPI
ncbi:MAG: hypothetical protein Q9214_005534, partial [Letrouitia sp. 1 TL-2023]